MLLVSIFEREKKTREDLTGFDFAATGGGFLLFIVLILRHKGPFDSCF